jgi:hypothetical protein
MNGRRSRTLQIGLVAVFISVVDAAVIFFTHPQEPHDSVLAGISMLLWPYVLYPIVLFVTFIVAFVESRRGVWRKAILGSTLVIVAWPLHFTGYFLNQKPWLSTAEKLHDRWPDVRRHTAYIIGISKPPEGVPLLISTLKDSDTGVRAMAAMALEEYGSRAETAIPALVAALDDGDSFVACRSADALASMRDRLDKVLPALIEHLNDKDSHREWCVAEAIGSFGPDATSALPALIEQLMAADAAVRIQVCKTLGAMGTPASGAVPMLTAALQDPDQYVRKAAREALASIQTTGERRVPVKD